MNFLMISKAGEGLGVLYRIGQEGNSIRAYIEQKEDREAWRGLIEQTTLPLAKEDEVVIFDQSGMGSLASNIARQNPVFGGSKFMDLLEDNRAFGMERMKECGIKVPQTFNFNRGDWENALNLIKSYKDKLVFKPSGDGLPSKLSYVPCDKEDLIQYLKFVRRAYGHEIDSFILQQFIKGTICSSELWCDGKHFVYPANQTVEVKKLMNDDIGPSTGCMGNLIWDAAEDSVIVAEGIAKMEEICVKNNYRGMLDLNAIVNEEGVWGLEWTPRFGYDSIPTILQLLYWDLGKLFSDFARGQADYDFPIMSMYAGGVRLSIPPMPLEPPKTQDVERVGPNKGIPIRGFKKVDEENIYFYEIKLGEENDLVHSAGTGAILVASDIGENPEDCFDLPYKILENCKIPDAMYRTDLGVVLPKMFYEVIEAEEMLNA